MIWDRDRDRSWSVVLDIIFNAGVGKGGMKQSDVDICSLGQHQLQHLVWGLVDHDGGRSH